MNLIMLCGSAGSGKDTVGGYLEQNGFATASFADSLKDCLSSIFGWDRTMIEGQTKESRAWREQVDVWWADRLNIPHFTPRFAMTNFGTDVMRKHFNNDIWILNTERKLSMLDGPIVIKDGRFPNEFAMVRRLGGRVIRVHRGSKPDWESVAVEAMNGSPEAMMEMQSLPIHSSEWSWMAETPDHHLDNNSDLIHLYQQIDCIIDR